jgi:hypothetical protein
MDVERSGAGFRSSSPPGVTAPIRWVASKLPTGTCRIAAQLRLRHLSGRRHPFQRDRHHQDIKGPSASWQRLSGTTSPAIRCSIRTARFTRSKPQWRRELLSTSPSYHPSVIDRGRVRSFGSCGIRTCRRAGPRSSRQRRGSDGPTTA